MINVLLSRVKNILLSPGREWQIIRTEESSYRAVLLRYTAVLALLPPAAAVAGRLTLDRRIHTIALGSSLSYVVASNSVWYAMYILDVVIVGGILTMLVSRPGTRVDFREGLKISAYSFTPLCLAGVLAVVPYMGWVMDAAILYSVYLLFLGIVHVAGVGKKQAVWYAAGSFLSAAVILEIINLLEYFAESRIMTSIGS